MVKKSADPMTSDDIFRAIGDRQVTALMFHGQMTDLFDFLGLWGFKRMHEYQYFQESHSHRRLCEYYINHHNKLMGDGNPGSPQVIPPDWVQYSRFDVTPQIRKQAVEKAFKDYKGWEMETLELYSQYSRTLAESGMLADSSMVADLVVEVSEELKDLDWRILQLKSLSYDPTEIMRLQEDIYHRYKKKMSKLDLSE